MTGLVFLHGWGFGPSTWAQWRTAFGDRPLCCLDTGYFGPGATAIPANPDGWVGIGHSLGFARLLGLREPWRGLVGLGAFLHFCPSPASPCGTPSNILEAMLARFETRPVEVLAKFYQRCGLKDAPPAVLPQEDLPRLRADLAALLTVNAAPPACPTLYVHAKDDRIVPVVLAEEAHQHTPGSHLALLETGGHAACHTRHAECTGLVRDFLHALG